MNMNMKSRWNSVSQEETSPAAETSDPPASAFLERRTLKQEGSLAYPVNGLPANAAAISTGEDSYRGKFNRS
jgi:hypothetical protein